MERGLIWLPLLGAFIGLAWAGWNEYQKLTVCQIWAQQFDRYKYDIACVLGQGDGRLIWGKPTRKGPVDLQELALAEIREIQIFVTAQDDRILSPAAAASLDGGTEPLGLHLLTNAPQPVQIPFTQLDLAIAWAESLRKQQGFESIR